LITSLAGSPVGSSPFSVSFIAQYIDEAVEPSTFPDLSSDVSFNVNVAPLLTATTVSEVLESVRLFALSVVPAKSTVTDFPDSILNGLSESYISCVNAITSPSSAFAIASTSSS